MFEKQDIIIASSVAEKIGVSIPTAARYLMNLYVEKLLDFDEVGNRKIKIWKLKKVNKQ